MIARRCTMNPAEPWAQTNVSTTHTKLVTTGNPPFFVSNNACFDARERRAKWALLMPPNGDCNPQAPIVVALPSCVRRAQQSLWGSSMASTHTTMALLQRHRTRGAVNNVRLGTYWTASLSSGKAPWAPVLLAATFTLHRLDAGPCAINCLR